MSGSGALPPRLRVELERLGDAAVLYSGGRDSEVLLRAAVAALGTGHVTALTADSPLLAGYYRRLTKSVAASLGVAHRLVPWDPLSIDEIVSNGPLRCYHCKKGLYSALRDAAEREGAGTVADGTNTDDLGEDRPGLRAAEELDVARPFLKASMSSADVQRLGRTLGMAGRFRPSDSCLATRIPPGSRLSQRELTLVEELEAPLRPLVKERFRAYVEGTRVMVHYRRGDATAVNRLKETLKDRARKEGIGRVIFVMED